MPEKPRPPKDLANLDSGWEVEEDDSGVSERPTVAPPFDLESFAKEKTAASVPEPAVPPASEDDDDSMEARIDRLLREELEPAAAAARARTDNALTLPPPAPLPDMAGGPATAKPALVPRVDRPPSGPSSEPMSRRETPRRVEQLEEARLRSAREDIGTGTLLSLANMRAPSNLPPSAARSEQAPRSPNAPTSNKPGPASNKPGPDDPVITLVGVEDARASSAEIEVDPMAEMHERFALGDYSGALVMAESLLEENPTHVEAREYAESCRTVLQQMYTAKIGPLNRVPVVEVARDQLRWLTIDHRAGFVLSLVDGVSSLEMILDVSGMPYLDALRILYELVQQRIISLPAE